jgi:hypothetical protein
MSTTFDGLFGEYVSKAAQARTAKWSAIGNVFGFLIGVTSIMGTVAKPVWWLLMPILLLSFAGILSLLRCFTLMHQGYVEITGGLARDRHKADDQKITDAKAADDAPDPLRLPDRFAMWCLYIVSILFITYTVLNAYSVGSLATAK